MPTKESEKKPLEEILNEPYPKDKIMKMTVGRAEYPYLPIVDVIETANSIFGISGWSRLIKSVEIEHVNTTLPNRKGGEPTRITMTIVTAVVNVTINSEGGVQSEGIGVSSMNASSFANAADAIISKAVARATKRALARFGRRLGLGFTFDDETDEEPQYDAIASPEDIKGTFGEITKENAKDVLENVIKESSNNSELTQNLKFIKSISKQSDSPVDEDCLKHIQSVALAKVSELKANEEK